MSGKRLMTTVERFKKHYFIDSGSGCWLWTAALFYHGYGTFSYEGRNQRAHRVSYLLFKGPIPDGLEIDHTCHNGSGCPGGHNCFHRRCVNPHHLEVVTHKINVERGEAGDYQVRKTHCPQGHPYLGDNLRTYQDGSRACKICQRAGDIKHRQRIKELEKSKKGG